MCGGIGARREMDVEEMVADRVRELRGREEGMDGVKRGGK